MRISTRPPLAKLPAMLAPRVLAAGIVLFATAASAETVKCQDTIVREGAKYAQAISKALSKCELSKIKGTLPASTDCRAENVAAKIAKSVAGLRKRIDQACGGADRVCGGDLTNEDSPAALGWPATCPNLENGACTNALDDCGDITECLTCIHDGAVDRTIALAFQFLEEADPGSDLGKCQQALGKETQTFLKKKSKELTRCWRSRVKGKHADACPDAGAPLGSPALRAAVKIAQAETKLRDRLCKRCGGDDRACGGGDDLTPAAIGFQQVCDDRTIPGGASCAGAISSLEALVDCTACVTEFEIDCMDRAQVQQFAAYPAECNPLPVCASTLRLDGDAEGLDLDLGSGGLAHDNRGPFLARLTLCLSGCSGPECTLTGPLANDGGAAFANQRCRSMPWIPCAGDADCPLTGGPCRFYLGPPTPLDEGGISLCAISEIAAPVTGTANTATGAIAVGIDLDVRLENANAVENTTPDRAHPCPPCVAGVCDGGVRDGMPCVVHGHAAVYGDDVSHDCPPGGGSFALGAGSTRMRLDASTTTTSKTLTTASPDCRAGGHTSLKCFCDTCNNLDGDPCFSDTDCPESPPGTPGICGGTRCLPPAPNAGTPCAGDAECGGSFCGTPGASAANACSGVTCAPNTPPDDDSIDEGTCSAGPFEGHCSLQTFKACLNNDDCNPPECTWCQPGQTCVFEPYECFADNGTIGNSVFVAGATEPPVGGVADATLGALFCIRPTGTPLFDGPWGLPGLGRATMPVTATFE